MKYAIALVVALNCSMSSVAVQGRTRAHHYAVIATWWEPKNKLGSGFNMLGEFDSIEAASPETKHFAIEDTTQAVTVSVATGYRELESSSHPLTLRLAIVFRIAPDAFNEPDSVIVELPYSKRIDAGRLERKIEIGDRIWTVKLICDDYRRWH